MSHGIPSGMYEADAGVPRLGLAFPPQRALTTVEIRTGPDAVRRMSCVRRPVLPGALRQPSGFVPFPAVRGWIRTFALGASALRVCVLEPQVQPGPAPGGA